MSWVETENMNKSNNTALVTPGSHIFALARPHDNSQFVVSFFYQTKIDIRVGFEYELNVPKIDHGQSSFWICSPDWGQSNVKKITRLNSRMQG